VSNIIEITDFVALHPTPNARLIGLDLGTKSIGLAVSDGLQRIANARETLWRKKFTDDSARLAQMAIDEKATAFIIGMPINMDGSEGPRAQATRAFVRNMASKTDLPFIFWDERLSTIAAERVMLEADLSRAKRAERIDAAAAAVILQGALDRLEQLRA